MQPLIFAIGNVKLVKNKNGVNSNIPAKHQAKTNMISSQQTTSHYNLLIPSQRHEFYRYNDKSINTFVTDSCHVEHKKIRYPHRRISI
jgi:hypothetical protein